MKFDAMAKLIVDPTIDGQFREILRNAGQTTDHQKLCAILHAYDKALEMPGAKIPTVLHAAIEAARKI